jgi:hypothetical protein
MTTISGAIRIRPDLVSRTCRAWPHVGLLPVRDPYQMYPLWGGSNKDAWYLRIRPDIATRIVPDFPRLSSFMWFYIRAEQRDTFSIG